MNTTNTPDAILSYIFSFIKGPRDSWGFEKYGWFNIMITCKRFLTVGRKVFDPSTNNNYYLLRACEYGYTEAVRWLLKDPRVSVHDKILRVACDHGHSNIVKLLLEDGRVNPAGCKNWPIQLAARQGYYEIVKLLMSDSRVTPSDDDLTAVRWAAFNHQRYVVELLITDDKVKQYIGSMIDRDLTDRVLNLLS